MVQLQLFTQCENPWLSLNTKKKMGMSKISPTHNFVKELSPSNELQNNKYLCLASHHLNKNIQNNLKIIKACCLSAFLQQVTHRTS